MNEELEKEAIEYAKHKSSSPVFQKAHCNDFIAGANSNFVKQQIIEAKIDILENVDGEYYNIGNQSYPIYQILEELKEQLKELNI